MARKWNDARFNAWVEGTHIPEDVMKMVEMIAEKIGISVYETTVDYKNVWGERISTIVLHLISRRWPVRGYGSCIYEVARWAWI